MFNRDQLVQAEREERVERLEAALDGVLEGYGKVLERVDRGDGEGEKVRPRVRKRKVGGDEDEEDDEEEEEGVGMGSGSAKKVRRG